MIFPDWCEAVHTFARAQWFNIHLWFGETSRGGRERDLHEALGTVASGDLAWSPFPHRDSIGTRKRPRIARPSRRPTRGTSLPSWCASPWPLPYGWSECAAASNGDDRAGPAGPCPARSTPPSESACPTILADLTWRGCGPFPNRAGSTAVAAASSFDSGSQCRVFNAPLFDAPPRLPSIVHRDDSPVRLYVGTGSQSTRSLCTKRIRMG